MSERTQFLLDNIIYADGDFQEYAQIVKETNTFLSKYAGMRKLYPASQKDFRSMYVLIYREDLEKQFPYLENETVEAWIRRFSQ